MDENNQDHESGLPSRQSKDELEEALKWLEELTNRQGKSPEPTNPVPSATIDSPFHGLIEGEEGDLPDWLREVPSTPNLEGTVKNEPESRLDWLAKMAQRESIEELPTLEWRRLGEPMQSALLPPSREGKHEGYIEGFTPVFEPDEPKPERLTPEERQQPIDEPISWLDPPRDEIDTIVVPEVVRAEETQPAEESPKPTVDEIEDEMPSVDDLDAAMAWIEELAASQDAPVEDIPSVVDRALASKLMSEAGLPQPVSPLDELGSESSFLEGNTPTHPFIEEEDFADTIVLVETMVADQGLSDQFSEETYKALTEDPSIKVDGSVSAEQTDADLNISPTESTAEEVEPIDTFPELEPIEPTDDWSDDQSFEEAMALLDEMAAAREPDPETELDIVQTVLIDAVEEEIQTPIPALEEYDADEIDALMDLGIETPEPEATDFTPWEDEQVDLEGVEDIVLDGENGSIDEVELVEKMTEAESSFTSDNDQTMGDLETTLMALDALALPTGKTLQDIDETLRTARVSSSRNISSALEWLESALAGEGAPSPTIVELDEEQLIAQMPEDPDAVLAWLEQMADDEEVLDSSVMAVAESTTSRTREHPDELLVEDIAEADLLNMPEDPDEAMAWLEGLARGEVPASEHKPEPELAAPLLEETPNELNAVEAPDKQEGEPRTDDVTEAESVAETFERDDAGTSLENEALAIEFGEAESESESYKAKAHLEGTEVLPVTKEWAPEAAMEPDKYEETSEPGITEAAEPGVIVTEADIDASSAGEEIVEGEAVIVVEQDLAADDGEQVTLSTEEFQPQEEAHTTIHEEQPPTGEAVDTPTRVDEHPDLSWIDLLKPLD